MGKLRAPWPHSLVGLPWPEAKAQLEARGEAWHEQVTRPPRFTGELGELRVVAERRGPTGLTVILAPTLPGESTRPR